MNSSTTHFFHKKYKNKTDKGRPLIVLAVVSTGTTQIVHRLDRGNAELLGMLDRGKNDGRRQVNRVKFISLEGIYRRSRPVACVALQNILEAEMY